MSLLQQSKSILFLILLIAFLYISNVSAQTEIFGFGGYMWTSTTTLAQGDLQIDNAPDYGLGIDITMRRGFQLELLWISSQTHVSLNNITPGLTEDLFDMNVHYFQVGGVFEIGRGKVRPFGALTIGASLWDAKDATRSDEWLAAFTFGFGFKFDLSESVGIRLQLRMLAPLIFSGGGIWVGTGGASIGVGSTAPFVQVDITAGVYITIGGRARPKRYKDL